MGCNYRRRSTSRCAAKHEQYFEILATFDRDSRAYIGFYVETERGLRCYRYKGIVHAKETPVRIPITGFGTRIRVSMMAVAFNGARLMLRDMQIGFSPAGTS